jgi:hypothetical protein
MNRRIAAIALSLPLALCACSSSPERYTCPNCGARLVKVGDALAIDAGTPNASAPAPAAPAAPTASPAPVAQAQAPAPFTSAAPKVYKVAPKQMIDLVQQALVSPPLNLKVVTSENGVIVTDWKEGYPGNFHIARRWDERTRFRVAIVPDVNDPTSASRLEITEQTQERSNERANWTSNPSISRPERVEEVAKAIDAKIKG